MGGQVAWLSLHGKEGRIQSIMMTGTSAAPYVCAPGLKAGPSVERSGARSRQSPPAAAAEVEGAPPPPAPPDSWTAAAAAPPEEEEGGAVPELRSALAVAEALAAVRRRRASARRPPPPLANASWQKKGGEGGGCMSVCVCGGGRAGPPRAGHPLRSQTHPGEKGGEGRGGSASDPWVGGENR